MTLRSTYAKPALTPQASLAKLRRDGLLVENEALALQYLTFVGHFRLKGYWFQLQEPETGRFRKGVCFSHILIRYECDREIRALVLEAVERLEVAIRTTLCNFLNLKYSPHWFLQPEIFAPKRAFGIGKMLAKIETEVDRSVERAYIKSYRSRYDDPYLPPSWAMSECVTLSLWSNVFAMLREPADKRAISSKFGIVQTEVFESWLHTLTVMRNTAAHHDRFIDKKMGVSPTNLKQKNIKFSDNQTVYASLTVIHVLLRAIALDGNFKSRLEVIQQKYGTNVFHSMGFPTDWETQANGWLN